jgi:hypothetical protein
MQKIQTKSGNLGMSAGKLIILNEFILQFLLTDLAVDSDSVDYRLRYSTFVKLPTRAEPVF